MKGLMVFLFEFVSRIKIISRMIISGENIDVFFDRFTFIIIVN